MIGIKKAPINNRGLTSFALTEVAFSPTILLMTNIWLSRIFSVCGILAPLTMITVVITAGMITPGYNQLRDTISTLSQQGSRAPQLLTTGFAVYGALIIGFAYAVYLRLQRGFKAYVAWLMLTLYGICMILAGVFQDSPGVKDAPLNTEGIFHNAVIITSCLSMLFGMWAFAGSVYKKPSWFGFTWFTMVASFMGLVLSIIFLVQSQVPFAGLLQRFFYLVILVWIEIVSIWLFRLSFKR
jgi:hypothetical membrane protein